MIGDNEVKDSRGVRLLSEILLYDVYRVDTRVQVMFKVCGIHGVGSVIRWCGNTWSAVVGHILRLHWEGSWWWVLFTK